MPFSPERTKEIQSRIEARLRSGQLNNWENSFLTNMDKLFRQHGPKTRLSDAQYRSLHKVLKLGPEASSPNAGKAESRASRLNPKHPKKSLQSRPRPTSVTGVITAPRRAARRVQRQLLVPLLAVFAVVALLGSLFDPASPPRTYPEASSISHAIVTGSRVNQREGPSTENGVMGVLVEGTRVQVLGGQGQWAQIRSNLGTGWMSSRYLSSERQDTGPARSSDRRLGFGDVQVIDGDTVGIRGLTANVRLVGFDTPETWRPSCTAERQLGERATARLRQMLRDATAIEFERVACSCQPGTEGTDRCNFGRLCGSLHVDGQDVGSILIREGLAARFRCGPTRCPPRPRVWCR